MSSNESNNTSKPKKNPSNRTIIGLYWTPKIYTCQTGDGRFQKYRLSFLQRIFMMLEFPNSSTIGEYLSYFNTLIIFTSVFCIIVGSLQVYQYSPTTCSNPACNYDPDLCPTKMICPPIVLSSLITLEFSCVIVFTVDFGTRLLLCSLMPVRLSGTVSDNWDEKEAMLAADEDRPRLDNPVYKYGRLEILFRYLFSIHSLIDTVSIIPTFLEEVLGNSTLSKVSFIRLFRLFRILRVTRISVRGRQTLHILTKTMYASREALAILLFFLFVVLTFFSSLSYYAEQGVYTIDSQFPNGQFVRPDGVFGRAVTPYDSIPTSIYYTIITLTTVGYGDLVPTTPFGRIVASFCCVAGILVLALPITIIGSNFQSIYKLETKKMARMNENVRNRKKANKLKIKRLWDEKFNQLLSTTSKYLSFITVKTSPISPSNTEKNNNSSININININSNQNDNNLSFLSDYDLPSPTSSGIEFKQNHYIESKQKSKQNILLDHDSNCDDDCNDNHEKESNFRNHRHIETLQALSPRESKVIQRENKNSNSQLSVFSNSTLGGKIISQDNLISGMDNVEQENHFYSWIKLTATYIFGIRLAIEIGCEPEKNLDIGISISNLNGKSYINDMLAINDDQINSIGHDDLVTLVQQMKHVYHELKNDFENSKEIANETKDILSKLSIK